MRASEAARTERARSSAPAIPSFVEFQHPKPVARPPSGPGWLHEIKYDGYRLQVRVADGRARLHTRAGKDWTERLPQVARAAAALPDCLLDGEVCALDAQGRPDFHALQDALASGRTGGLSLFLFDLLFADGRDWRGAPLVERRARLAQLLDEAAVEAFRFVDAFEAAGPALLASACRMGLEGIVSKRASAPYHSGERSDAWQKSKCQVEMDVRIVGWRGEHGRLGSLLAAVRDGDVLRYAGRIETGFSPERDRDLARRLEALETPTPPPQLQGRVEPMPNTHWVRPGLTAVVNITGVTREGRLRHGSAFKDWREDPDPPRPKRGRTAKPGPSTADQPSAAPAPRPGRAPDAPGRGVLGVEIPEPRIIAIPADPPVTRLELAQYLADVAPDMLPYLSGRPCSVRLPPVEPPRPDDYERHAGQGKSRLADAPEVALVHLAATGKTYFQFDQPAALAAAAAHGAIEFHAWQSLPGRPDLPGRFVVDLDPGEGVAFEAVAQAACFVRERLGAVGLPSFAKTTGGKGLHVVAPFRQDLAAPVAWDEAKAFCRRLCEAIAAQAPDLYTTSLKKADRPGRIFLDYLRNGRTNTAIALLSPRLAPGAPVSMPLRWEEVGPRLDPGAFTVRTAPRLLARRRREMRKVEAQPGSIREAMAAFDGRR